MAKVTRRQFEIIQYKVSGLNNKQIADRMIITEHTVEEQITAVWRRICATDETSTQWKYRKLLEEVEVNNDN